MNGDKLAALVEKESLDQFDATKDTYLVVEDKALKDDFAVVVHCFTDENTALRCARALAHGNVDYRVLRVTGQTLVIATDNEL